MKAVYFIRHGQSRGNVSLVEQQNEHTLLTDTGLQQARVAAEHIKKLPIDTVIASTYARTQATAGEISRASGVPVEFSPLFVERRRPRVQRERRKIHPSWLWAQVQLTLFSRRSGYRISDEETAEDLLIRAHQALDYLAARPESHLLVVTHATFMRSLYAAMTVGEGVTGRAYLKLTRHMALRNTALMSATHENGKWQVQAWNVDASTL